MIYNIYLNKIVKVFKLSVYILTGQIGSGKTEAVEIFKKLGFSCFCADEIVRELYKEKKVKYMPSFDTPHKTFVIKKNCLF